MPYSETGTIGGTPPRHFELLRDVPVDAICARPTTADAVEVKRWGGAIARGDSPARAIARPVLGHRRRRGHRRARAARHRRLVPELPQGHLAHRRRVHGRGPARLLELKRAYDPGNLFGSATRSQ